MAYCIANKLQTEPFDALGCRETHLLASPSWKVLNFQEGLGTLITRQGR